MDMLKLNCQENKPKQTTQTKHHHHHIQERMTINAILPELGSFTESTENITETITQAEPEIRPRRLEREIKVHL